MVHYFAPNIYKWHYSQHTTDQVTLSYDIRLICSKSALIEAIMRIKTIKINIFFLIDKHHFD